MSVLDYMIDFLRLFNRVVEQDGVLHCTRAQIVEFYDQFNSFVHLVTNIPMVLPDAPDDEDDETLPERDRLQEFIAVYSPAFICYSRIKQMIDK